MTSFYVRRGGAERGGMDHILDTRSTLYTGEQDFSAQIGEPTSLECDLLLLASAVFAADRASPRGEREDIARHIHLSLPVVNLGRLLPCVPAIEKVLRILSDDCWTVELRHSPGRLEEQEFDVSQLGRTLLFSGGLDSFSAAARFAREAEPLQLVSHITRNNRTRKAQLDLVQELVGDAALAHFQFFASSRSGEEEELDHAVETSQRTRSFLFMTLGALTARRAGHHKLVVIAENGQLAIHLPLTNGRIGAFSTHTAHPDVLAAMKEFLRLALGFEVSVENPFVHLTKAEVVARVCAEMPEVIGITESCWKNARVAGDGAHHCGECIPCYVRRIAIESHRPDPTRYSLDPWGADIATLPAEDTGRRNLVDLTEFVRALELYEDEEIMAEWPELYSDHVNAGETIAMYRRFAAEAREVLGRYRGPAALLQ